jgi:valyl-tRNA synthetase
LRQIDVAADPDVLRERYARQAAKLDDEVARLERKFADPRFAQNAKPDLVEAERAKLADYAAERARIRGLLAALEDGG